MEIILLFWVLISIIAGFVAASKGRNAIVWIIATLIFPLAFLFLLFGGNARRCPFCREGVHKDATVCPHCQRDLPVNDALSEIASADRVVCTACGASNKRERTTCRACSAVLPVTA